MTIGDVEILKRNCDEYARTKGSIDVLRNANGKNHYTEIAKIVGLHQTAVSSLLKKAEKWGLAKKIKVGIYKKNVGILGYMPIRSKERSSLRTTPDLIKKITKGKRVKINEPFNRLVVPCGIFTDIDKMTDAYRRLYGVENLLRELIRKVLGTEDDWWKNRVPPDIQTKVKETMDDTPYHAAKRKDELEYAHLGQLKDIIIWKKNWNDFLTYLKERDKNAFIVTINRAIPARNAVGHCIPLRVEDLRVVNVRFEDIFKMIQ